MKRSDVEATGSGGSRAEDSEARTQVAGYGARPARGRPGLAKPERHLFEYIDNLVKCVWRMEIEIKSPLLLAFSAFA